MYLLRGYRYLLRFQLLGFTCTSTILWCMVFSVNIYYSIQLSLWVQSKIYDYYLALKVHEIVLQNCGIDDPFFIQIDSFEALDVVFYLGDCFTQSSFEFLQLSEMMCTLLVLEEMVFRYLVNWKRHTLFQSLINNYKLNYWIYFNEGFVNQQNLNMKSVNLSFLRIFLKFQS